MGASAYTYICGFRWALSPNDVDAALAALLPCAGYIVLDVSLSSTFTLALRLMGCRYIYRVHASAVRSEYIGVFDPLVTFCRKRKSITRATQDTDALCAVMPTNVNILIHYVYICNI